MLFRQKIFQAAGVALFALMLFLLAGLVCRAFGSPSVVGTFGKLTSDFLFYSFGYASFFVAGIVFAASVYFFSPDRTKLLERIFTALFMLISFSALLSRFYPAGAQTLGGMSGNALVSFLMTNTGNAGSWIIIVMLNSVGLILGGLVSVDILLHRAKENTGRMGSLIKKIISKRRIGSDEKIPLLSKKGSSKGGVPWITKETVLVEQVSAAETEMSFPVERVAEKCEQDERDCREPLKCLSYGSAVEAEDVFASIDSVKVDFGRQSGIEAFNRRILPPVLAQMSEPESDVREVFSIPEAIALEAKKEIIFSSEEKYEFDTPSGISKNRIKTIDEYVSIPVYSLKSQEMPETENSAVLVSLPEQNSFSGSADFSGEEKLSSSSQIAAEEDEGSVNELVEDFEDGSDVSSEVIEATHCASAADAEADEANDFRKDFSETSSAEKVFEEIPINQEYIIPLSCFDMSEAHDYSSWQSEVHRNSELLVKTLNDFGIESKVSKVNRGPVITLYEVQIAPGIKVTRIVGLADDIAMALAASRVRVVAPIPGKAAIGIEIPNGLREMVTLGDLLVLPEYKSCEMSLKVAMGKDILGKPVMLDMKKQPHILIAGATGAGKSVCVNTIIASLICNYDPNYLRFIMVDPKMVELQLYNGIPHQLTPVITEPAGATKALKWAIYEMERRYKLLSEYGVRDIERYNQKVASRGYRTTHEKLPFIVIIVDELADLMMVAPKEMENHITRIAQKARAVGIHLVLATQRPSVDIITGVIKANFPARIAFQVAQKIDSRTILDQNGAEKLLGKGDMLYQSPTSSFPVRIQGAFVSEDEIEKIVQHTSRFGRPKYIDIEESLAENDEFEDDDIEESDEMFTEALKIIEQTKKASASYLQRRLSIGYNRAARIIERMEELGYVGPQQGSKQREVYL